MTGGKFGPRHSGRAPRGDPDTEEGSHVKTEAETGVMPPQARTPRPPEAGRDKEEPSQQPSEGARACYHLGLKPLASRSVREYILLFSATQFGIQQSQGRNPVFRAQESVRPRAREMRSGDERRTIQDLATQGQDLDFLLVKWDCGQRSGKT